MKNNISNISLLLIGRLLALVNEAEPLPEQNSAWENAFISELRKIQKASSRKIETLIHTALCSARYDDAYNTIDSAIKLLASATSATSKEEGTFVNDPSFIGKQVVARYQENDTLLFYGRVQQTLVHLNGRPYDTWAVKINAGPHMNGQSSDFILYPGPPYQPEQQVFYQGQPATILGPTFTSINNRGSFGFNLMTSIGEEKYGVPFTALKEIGH